MDEATGDGNPRRKDTSNFLRKDATDQSFPDSACYGFSVVAKVKPGREQAIRDYGKNIEKAVKADPSVLASLNSITSAGSCSTSGSGLHFMYQGIFDTDFDKYIDDAIAIFN